MSGVRTELTLDQAPHAKDSIIVAKRVQDVEPILENNKALRSLPQKSDWGRHIAEIPNVVIEGWLADEARRGHVMRWGSQEFLALIRQKLNDPDWAYLRVDR